MQDIYYVDGKFVPEDQCLIPAKDLVVLRGYGVFDFLVTYNRRPFYLEEHVARLANSARHIRLKLNHSEAEIMEVVEETVKRNPHHGESTIRIIYTGGISSDGVTPEGNGILVVMVAARKKLPASWYTKGAKVITNRIQRFIPDAKSTNYLAAIYAMEHAHQQGAIESIYVDRQGRLLEGTTSNIFFFKDSRLVTGKQDILPGVTRQVLLNLLKEHFALELRDIHYDELAGMNEAFISSSHREVVPIVGVDDIIIGQGRPGACTQKAMDIFRNYVSKYGQGEV